MEVCKYCHKPENKQILPCLQCKQCKKLVHVSCLSSKTTPGNFYGDIYFEYVCGNCSENGLEVLKREKMSWLYVLSIVLSHLSKNCMGISNNGYFHWKTHIGSFIISNWELLFDSSCKRKKSINSSFSGVLSAWNHTVFESGSDLLKESGWWRISKGFSPALIKYLYIEFNLWKQRLRKNSSSFTPDRNTEYNEMQKILADIGFDNLMVVADEDSNPPSVENESNSNIDSTPSSPKSEMNSEASNLKNSVDFANIDMYDDLSNYLMDCDDALMNSNFEDILLDFDVPESDLNALKKNIIENVQKSPQNRKISASKEIHEQNEKDSGSKFKKASVDHQFQPVKSLFSASASSQDMPWLKGDNSDSYKNIQPLLTTEYAEVQTLNRLNNVCRKAHFMKIEKNLIRYRAKLALRRVKRNKQLPLFNLDTLVSRLAYYPTQDSLTQIFSERRVLDQFQVKKFVFDETVFFYSFCSICGIIKKSGIDVYLTAFRTTSTDSNYGMRLVSSHELNPFISPYSGKLLKPYIWRDLETVSPWSRLMNEIKSKKNEKTENFPLDYCYVRPQHIASINSLCEHYFWPGIDLSDTLLYPEFSCVALYKKIVVGFAFLVPDVSLNEAYISFVFTRPEWRKCGIASFMIYHLTQTCIDKDITLHVAASNPAILLYQKFGFKIEEFLQEFYDKYFAPESKECKHAFFLRLSRS